MTEQCNNRADGRRRAIELGAVTRRYIHYEKKDYFRTTLHEFHDLEYYFDGKGNEIGYYNEPCRAFHIFESTRKWCPELTARMASYRLLPNGPILRLIVAVNGDLAVPVRNDYAMPVVQALYETHHVVITKGVGGGVVKVYAPISTTPKIEATVKRISQWLV